MSEFIDVNAEYRKLLNRQHDKMLLRDLYDAYCELSDMPVKRATHRFDHVEGETFRPFADLKTNYTVKADGKEV